jgi:paraquat-inducible protein B
LNHPASSLEPPGPGEAPPRLPKAGLHHRLGYAWIWLTPLAALVLVAYLIYSLVAEHGPTISITFQNADGLTAEQTEVRYKAVTLGRVENIELGEDLSRVVVKVRMSGRAKALLTEETRFWVVRPRLGGGLRGFQAGLETLVSGAYIAIDPGPRQGPPKKHFEGLEEPPSVRSDEPGTVYFLQADSLGGISAGAPIFCRDVEVGRVLSYELEKKSLEDVRIRIFVREPYDDWVVPETRFWNASGLHVGTGSDGLEIGVQSVQSLFSGSIQFRSRSDSEGKSPSEPESTFHLYPSRAMADVDMYGQRIRYVSYFQSSVRGLTEGSEVHMFGKTLGAVTSVELLTDPRPDREGNMVVRVEYVLQPERGLRERDWQVLGGPGMQALVANRMRVVLETSNFLTGQKVLSLRYVPGAAPEAVASEGKVLVLPSVTQGLDDLSAAAGDIASSLASIPFGEIGQNLNRTLASVERVMAGPELEGAIVTLDATFKEVHSLVQRVEAGLGPALLRLPGISERLEHAVGQADAIFGRSGYGSNSTMQRNLERMMDQVGEAARSIRLLADFLNRHPEAVLSGRKADSQ